MARPISISFKQWCEENDLQWILDLWDYKKNNISPENIAKGTGKQYYFKCERGLHDSIPVTIVSITGKKNQRHFCQICQSFGQWCIDNDFYDLIEQMLCVDPTKRCNAKKCLEHSWFSEYN